MLIENNKTNIEKTERAPLKREAPFPLKRPRSRKGPLQPYEPRDLEPLFKNKDLQFDQNTGFQGGASRRKGYKLAAWSLIASFIDALVLVAGSSFFIIAFSWIMKSSVGSVITQLLGESQGLLLYGQVFFVFSWVYLIAIRVLRGSTIGEWACDLRLGQPHERLKTNYSVRVAARSTVILLTGILTLPMLSLLLGTDIPGKLSGLKLFSLK